MSRKFDQLVKEACAAEHALRNHTACRQLSLQCFVSEALRACSSTEEKLSEFQAKLAERNGTAMPLRGIAMYMRAIKPMIQSGKVYRPPLKYSKTCFPGRDLAEPELRDLGASIYHLWAIAATEVAERHPEAFGAIDDLSGFEEKEAALKVRRDELCARVGKEWSQDDLEIGEIKSDGAALITFKLAPNMVPVAPRRDCGLRLVNYLCKQ